MGTVLTADIADFKVSDDPSVELITYSLGSCIGVAIWDHTVPVGGLLHYMLSDSAVAPERAKENPALFADTGIPVLFRSMFELGAVKKRMTVRVAGGARLYDTNDSMDIGRRNYVMPRKIFWKNGVLIDAEHVGGHISRTVKLDTGSGRVTVENRGMGRIEI